jgi:rubrerythrin
MIFDVEAPEYDEARAGMSVRAALESAMRSEVKAHDFFAAALLRVEDAEVRALFEELRDEELEHQEWVRLELGKQPIETRDASEPDEPVAH